MATCSCGEKKAPFRIRKSSGGFYPGYFCETCKAKAAQTLKNKGSMEYEDLLKNIYGGPTPVEANPEKKGSKARFDRHRQAPPECFHTQSYRTVPLTHTSYPKTGPYMVPGALAVTSRIKAECAAKYAERGVRVRYRQWAIQSVLTPKSAGLRPTKAERALENPPVLYTVPVNNVRKYGKPFFDMREWHHKKVGPNPKMGEVLKLNPMFKILSSEPTTVGFDKTPAMVVTVEMAKGTKVMDAIVTVKNHAYSLGWIGTPTVGQKGRIARFTFKEQTKTSALTYEDYKEAIEGEGWAIGDYKDMIAKAASGHEKAMLEHILKEEQEHLTELQNLMKETGIVPSETHNPAHNPVTYKQATEIIKSLMHNTMLARTGVHGFKVDDDKLRFLYYYILTDIEQIRFDKEYPRMAGLLRITTGFWTKKDMIKAWPEVKPGWDKPKFLVDWVEAPYMNPEANRHYTSAERRAITSSPEFKAWVKTRTKAGFKPPKQGAFHAFMTDVGKSAVKTPLPVWKKDPTRADLKKEDVPSMKKYYYGLGEENPSIEAPVWILHGDKVKAVPKMEGYKDMNGYILKIGPRGGWRWQHPTDAGRYIPHSLDMKKSEGEGVIRYKDQTPELQVFIKAQMKMRGIDIEVQPTANPAEEMPELSRPGDKFEF